MKGRRVIRKKHDPDQEIPAEPDMDKVVAWRYKGLQELGFEDTMALRLAGDRTVDVYKLGDLLAAGCSHAVAADIYS